MNLETTCSENLNKELAYLLGVYLTDGSISYKESYTFQLSSIDKDFVESTLNFYKKINPKCIASVNIQKGIDREWPDGRKSKCQDQYHINVGFAEFGLFFKNQTGDKHHIPFIIWNASDGVKRWFIAGVMDGDGWISKTIRENGKDYQYRTGIGGVEEGWIYEFERLLQSMGVKTCKPEIDIRLPRAKPIVRFSIKTDSFVSHGLFFTIKRKQARLKEYIEKRSTT